MEKIFTTGWGGGVEIIERYFNQTFFCYSLYYHIVENNTLDIRYALSTIISHDYELFGEVMFAISYDQWPHVWRML